MASECSRHGPVYLNHSISVKPSLLCEMYDLRTFHAGIVLWTTFTHQSRAWLVHSQFTSLKPGLSWAGWQRVQLRTGRQAPPAAAGRPPSW